MSNTADWIDLEVTAAWLIGDVMSQLLEIREDDTEPQLIVIGKRGETDLSNLSSSALYMKKQG